MEIKEFIIPVPWGHIAVKGYGKEEDPMVLTVHGLCDNLGSFETLIPLLPKSFYYLCIDLPGHGKSSSFPPYTFITETDYIFTLKLITDYLNRRSYILLGHSKGGQLLMFFAQLYNHLVDKLIVLDSYYLLLDDIDYYKEILLDDIESLHKINTNVIKQNIPEYTYDEVITRLINSRALTQLNKKNAAILAKRMIIPVGNGKYRLSVDPRFRVLRKMGFDKQFVLKWLPKNPITCPCLFIIALESKPLGENYEIIYETIKKYNSRQCSMEVVDGDHDVHISNPQCVAQHIKTFLTCTHSKL